VKLNRTSVVLPLAGLLVIAGAGAVFATSGGAPSTTNTVVAAAATPSPTTGTTTMPPVEKDTALTSVLDDLVAKGTINSSQKTAILDALTAERTARRAARQAERAQIQQFLADGVITQAEIDQLPADSYLRTLTTLLDDGKITTDELRGLGRGLFGGRGGHGMGGMFGGGKGMGPNALPSASPTTGG
jgi:polyhydroxyalkanoate synthesis regulator phasin